MLQVLGTSSLEFPGLMYPSVLHVSLFKRGLFQSNKPSFVFLVLLFHFLIAGNIFYPSEATFTTAGSGGPQSVGVRRGIRGKEWIQEGKMSQTAAPDRDQKHPLSSALQGLPKERLNGSWGGDGSMLCSARHGNMNPPLSTLTSPQASPGPACCAPLLPSTCVPKN